MKNIQITLPWALERLAQLQGEGIHVLRLRAALASTAEPRTIKELMGVCRRLDLNAPLLIDKPDRARLPMMCWHDREGWGLIVDRNPQERWVVEFSQGTHALDETELGQVALVIMRQQATQAMLETFEGVLKHSMRQYRGVLFEASLASVFMGILALAIMMFSMQVYDRVIPTRSEQTLIILSMGVALAISIELAMKFARSHIMDPMTAGLDSRLSRDIFQRLLGIRIDQLPGSVGSLAAQIRGYEQIRSFYTSSTLFALVDFPMALLFLAILAMIGSPIVALVPLVCAILALTAGISRHRRVQSLANEGAQAANRKTGLLVEAVEGAETIKAGAGGWKFLSRWIDANTETIRQDIQMRRTSEGAGYLAASLQQLSYVGIVAVGAWVVIQGEMTMGALIACSIIGGRIMAPIVALPGLIVQHAHARAAMRSLEKLYELQTDNHGVTRPLVPQRLMGDFYLQEVHFSYGDNPPAISVAQLRIHAGEKIAVLGAIGAGKSTLLKLLAGLYKPTGGRVLIDGLAMEQVSRQVLGQHVGYLQQDHRLFQGTLRENLLIGAVDPGDDAMRHALVRSGLIQLVSSHPRGLDLPILEGGKGLSGGQRQLVAFTRLLLTNPHILLLDEPTANMDQAQEMRCLAVLAEEIKSHKTLVVVTHKPSLLPLVDRIVVVAGNHVVMDGPRNAVLDRLKQGYAPGQKVAENVSAATGASLPDSSPREGS